MAVENEKKYYKDLDFIRAISCIAVLLYHLDILKGGYLAVCTFFVLSGYLSAFSLFYKEKISLISYYKSRFIKLYIPLLIVVFITISFYSLFSSFNWVNLKPETTSVLLGYNNIWQISTNLDYFTKSATSFFTHFWFISILIQFDIIFPLIFLSLKKIGDKVSKKLSCGFLSILSISLFIYLITSRNTDNFMNIYYGTIARSFSFIVGINMAFFHYYYKNYFPKFFSSRLLNREVFYSYLVLLLYFLTFTIVDSKTIVVLLIIVTLISSRLIKYGMVYSDNKNTIIGKIIKWISSISYEVYLIQYPVIFFFNEISMSYYLKIPLIMFIIFLLSCLLHFSLDYKKDSNGIVKQEEEKITCLVFIILIASFGVYNYIITKDYTSELKKLEEQMAKNEELLKIKQDEYKANLDEEQEKWNKVMEDLSNGEEAIKDIVTNLPIVGIGDSVLLGAASTIYERFPNAYVDAKVSRTDYEANGVLTNLKQKGSLGDPVIIALGTNGQCGDPCRKVILNTIENRTVFWINVSNDYEVHVNSSIEKFVSLHDNVHLIDWYNISKNHKEYFVPDGVHLTPAGKEAYTNAIYDAIYKLYYDEFQIKKNEILSKHEDEEKNKISFYGNDLLINAFDELKEKFPYANFKLSNEYTYEKLLKELKNGVENKTLTYRIVLGFDNSFEITPSQYEEILNICKDYQVIIISLKKMEIKYNNLYLFDFYTNIKNNREYLMVDKIHLTSSGNKELVKLLDEKLNRE